MGMDKKGGGKEVEVGEEGNVQHENVPGHDGSVQEYKNERIPVQNTYEKNVPGYDGSL
jgi:hypothetical protein